MSTEISIPQTHAACVYDKPGTISIAVKQVPTPEPGPGEVLVRLTHSGVCHSDYAIMTNGWAFLTEPTHVDQVGGHEGIGKVVKLGPDCEDTGVKLGDRVGIKWCSDVCRECLACKTDREGFCLNAKVSGYFVPGTFQQFALSPASYVTPIPESVPSDIAAPMLCGGLTVYSALKKTGAKEGDWVVISGAGGGLGHLACQIASRGLGFKVVGVDTSSKKTFVLQECGAHTFVGLDRFPQGPKGNQAIAHAVRIATGGDGAAAVVVCTAANAAYAQALDFLRFGGTLVCVGMPEGPPMPIPNADPNSVLNGGWNITASSVGSQQEAIKVLEMTGRGVVKPKYTLHKMDELEDIFKKMHEGKLLGRTVIEL